MNLFRIPLIEWPRLAQGKLLRQLTRRFAGTRPAPELSDADLDFFMGGTDAVEAHLNQSTFHFFAASDFGPSPAPEGCQSILDHHIYLLGETFEVGKPIHWRRDFRTGYEWPKEHISQFELVTTQGDVKVPWQLSRFQHGLTLGLGYTATGEARYAAEWVRQFNHWRQENPPEVGPNWGNAMEAAIRAANWIATYQFLRPALEQSTGEAVLKALIQHGRFIFSHLEEYWPPTNHILANLCGLIWIGLFLRPETKNEHASPEPQHWLDYGWRALQQQLRRQVLPDGADYEASTAYHRFVTEMVGSTVRLAELNQLFVLPELHQIMTQMEALVEALRKPEGTLPLFGDEDGGYFPAPQRIESDSPQTGWQAFPHGGWYIHRDREEYLAIRAGNNGQAGWGGHAHNDALSFEYALGPRTFIVDPSTYTYTADPATRNLFRSTAYHNTLRIDGEELSRIPANELFRLENDVAVKATFAAGKWEGEHNGYARLGVTHERRFVKQANGWLIHDKVTGTGEHLLEWSFHFAIGCPVKVDGLQFQTYFPQGPNICLSTQRAIDATLGEGWVSPTYGVRALAPVAHYDLKALLPVEVSFMLSKV